MKLVICVIIDRELHALLLIEPNPGRGYWFPIYEIESDETRTVAAKRIANQVNKYIRFFLLNIFLFFLKLCPNDTESLSVFKVRCCDTLPYLASIQTYFLLSKGQTVMNFFFIENSLFLFFCLN